MLCQDYRHIIAVLLCWYCLLCRMRRLATFSRPLPLFLLDSLCLSQLRGSHFCHWSTARVKASRRYYHFSRHKFSKSYSYFISDLILLMIYIFIFRTSFLWNGKARYFDKLAPFSTKQFKFSGPYIYMNVFVWNITVFNYYTIYFIASSSRLFRGNYVNAWYWVSSLYDYFILLHRIDFIAHI